MYGGSPSRRTRSVWQMVKDEQLWAGGLGGAEDRSITRFTENLWAAKSSWRNCRNKGVVPSRNRKAGQSPITFARPGDAIAVKLT